MSSKATMEQLFFITCDDRISKLLKYKLSGRGIELCELSETDFAQEDMFNNDHACFVWRIICQLKGTPAKENIIFKELRRWGFNVDVEVFTLNKTNEKDHGIRNQ